MEQAEDAGVASQFAEDVEILRGSPDAPVGRHRIGAGEEKGDTAFLQQPQTLLIKENGVLRRLKLDSATISDTS